LDAADAGTYDGSPVAQWRDKSGLGHHMAQSNGPQQPTVSTAALNGKNVLLLNGFQWLVGSPVLRQASTNFSFFGVWKKANTSDTGVLFEQYGEAWNAGTRCSFMASQWDGFGFTGQNVDLRPVPIEANVWKVSGCEYDGRDANNIVFWDSAAVYGGTLDHAALQIGATAAKVGANIGGGECLNGALAEVIVYEGGLSEIDRNRILYYLQTKWGVGDTYQDVASIIDFSHGCLPAGWAATGDAFANHQPFANFPGTRYNNTGYFIDSYSGGNNPGSDAQTGTLTGNEFVLSNNTVRLRVGGGYQESLDSLCQVRLERKTVVGDWEIVRRATGASIDWMNETRWNVNNLVGQTLRFVAVDDNTGGWGCLRFDNVRLLDEAAPSDFTAVFADGKLPAPLLAQKPYASPTVEVTGGGTLRIFCNGYYNAWSEFDLSPKVLFQTFGPDTFSLQTHLTAFSYQGTSYCHAGLILVYETAGANRYDNFMFGPFGDSGKVRVERAGVGSVGNEWAGNISNVYLRVTGAKGKLTFLCSQEGTNWTEIASTSDMQGRVLLNAGLFAKTYTGDIQNFNSEFDSLSYRTTTTNSPAGVPGCVLWLDADDASSIVTGAGGGVLQWRDKSGWGNHVAQTESSAQPVVTPAGLNGRATLAFNGADFLSGPPVWQQGETNFTTFAVWRKSSLSDSQVIVEQAGPGVGARASLLAISGGTYGFNGQNNDAHYLGTYSAGAWNLSGLEYSGAAADNVYLDAAGVVSKATVDGTCKETVGVTALQVGRKVTMSGEFLQGDVAEILMFNRALTAAERYNVLYYLQQKWQLGNSYYGSPADIPAQSLTLSDEPVDLHGRTETYAALTFAEGSVVANGSLICTGAVESAGAAQVNGGLTLGSGVVLRNAQTGAVDVNGTLTIGGGATVRVQVPASGRAIHTTLYRFDLLVGEANLDDWRIEGVPTSWKASVYVENNSAIVLKAALVGTIISIR